MLLKRETSVRVSLIYTLSPGIHQLEIRHTHQRNPQMDFYVGDWVRVGATIRDNRRDHGYLSVVTEG
jgi:hypothetical protein